jgi:hypothetical protein
MKLEDKFNGLVYPYLGSSMLVNEPYQNVIDANSNECAKIAREFTVGFTHWLMLQCSYMPHCVWMYEGQEYTQEELLVIYEKILENEN